MITPPAISGCSGRSMPLAANPRWSSQTATTTAAATTTMKAVFQTTSVAMMTATRTTALVIAAGRFRPARPCSWAVASCVEGVMSRVERSDLEQLGLLVLEEVVDRVGVLLGQTFQPLLGARDVVLARVAVLLHPLELLLGVASQGAHGHPPLLGLVAGDLDVLLATLLGELGEDAPEDLAVFGG